MRTSQLARFERRLLGERRRVEALLANVASPAPDAASERGRFGDDLGTGAAGVTGEDDRAVVAHAAHELEEIDRALAQLRHDPEHYGVCASCSRPIALERLRLVPGTRHCQLHAPEGAFP